MPYLLNWLDKLSFVNSDEQPELVEQFSVQSLPFFVAKSASGVKKTKVGAMQKVRMLEFIKEAI